MILTTYNSEDHIENTLTSILEQDYPFLEIIIKDGISNDSTKDIVMRFINGCNLDIHFIQKHDCGIYDAMNQGYECSTGDIIAFFNDRFVRRDAVSQMVNAMNQTNPGTGKPYIGAHADLVYSEGDKIIRSWHMGQGEIRDGWMPGHPTLYLRRAVYEKYGLYDTSYRISADYEFMIRILKDGNRLAYLPETIISMYYGGTSNKGLSNYLESLKEGHRALTSNGVKHAWLIDMKRTIRVLKQFRWDGHNEGSSD